METNLDFKLKCGHVVLLNNFDLYLVTKHDKEKYFLTNLKNNLTLTEKNVYNVKKDIFVKSVYEINKKKYNISDMFVLDNLSKVFDIKSVLSIKFFSLEKLYETGYYFKEGNLRIDKENYPMIDSKYLPLLFNKFDRVIEYSDYFEVYMEKYNMPINVSKTHENKIYERYFKEENNQTE